MYIERKQDLSVFYRVKEIIATEDTSSIVTVTDEFPETMIASNLPTISIENHMYKVRPFELGNRQGVDMRTWFIDIFAKNKSQRDDYAYLIANELQNSLPVYDYDEGFPPDVSPTQIGGMDVLEVEVTPIRVFSQLVSTLYWRSKVRILAIYNQTP